ncbi:MAG: hypothetical protein KKD92_14190 [Proteobacteria bacterium]|nr:hypothetical protein [Pseudomonadota bacterium]
MEDGLVQASEEGTPKGSILSPLLSNIYLHYALDLWFSRRFKRRCQGEAYYFRFADDFLACFQYKADALAFRQQLEDRLEGFKLKRRTNRKKFGQSLNKFTDWARRSRCALSKGQMLRKAKIRVAGHLNYYAITDNSERCSTYIYHVTRILFKWLNRKSQRRSYTWEGYRQVLKRVGWPKPNVRKDLNPCCRAEAI